MSGIILGAALIAAGIAGASKASASSGSSPNSSGSSGDSGDAWTRYDALFQKYGSLYQVPWTYLKAIALNESDLGRNPRVVAGEVSEDGLSWGLMQLRLKTARDFEGDTTIEDLKDPETAVRIAAQFLKWIMRQFEVVELRYDEWCIKSYNAGVQATKEERAGTSTRTTSMKNAQRYWERFQRNLKRVVNNQ